MNSLKGLLVVAALAVMAPPAFAFNGGAPQGAPGGYAQPGPPMAPSAQGCAKANKPPMSPEQRAQRKAMKAQRQAQGMQDPQKVAQHRAKSAARRARCGTAAR